MKHLFKQIFSGTLLLVGFNANAQVDKLIKQLHNPNDKNVLVAAHRGDWRNAPENSLQAYKLAIDMGVDIIEVDLNRTSDGVLIIMHDETIDRTTNGKGKPSDYTLEQLKKFHLRNGLGVVSNHSIPTLEEVMLLAKGKILINLDKSYPYYNEAYRVLKKTGTLQQAIFKTDAPYIDVRAKYPTILDSITFMPVVYLDKPTAKQIITEYQKEIKPVAFELIFAKDTSGIISNNAFIPQHGSKIWINSLWASLNAGHDDDLAVEREDIKNSWEWLINQHARIIQTDRPKQLLEYLKRLSLHP
ncbi:glycerophosphodiester phosphodiesterase family protein [Mucilaginibacter jinjuensis]|uniref:Glycerophosphodiester phosphodiesterase family protein n=1 Tax=Mucilaginibacter jinjuensis TaxID=1176721 RepID=A0ABY7TAM2_9SPHI|nr:glycerophosphodiester phosphodiesterase family protein [Mucilaginibacter jinjuensis]WCT13397.1 glycerophosphodiester phosphodiesterase family protein [Mucilaginibacter jinjuensis]